MEEKRRMERITRIILVLVMIVLLIFICVRLKARYFVENGQSADSEQAILGSSGSGTDNLTPTISDTPSLDTNTGTEEIFKAVLLGDSQFFYVSDGNIEIMTITDVPSLIDADDSFMKIWEFSVVDMNGDGEDEVILFVVGAAGDTGGKVILHRIGDKIYGYITDNRTLVDLKTDGTYNFSDPTGVVEAGIAAITAFSETGYTVDKISYETGTYEGWNTFVVDHQLATEEEYLDAVSKQDKKQNAEWYDFDNENINKIKSIVATALSLGMVLAGSLTSFAAELPAQDHEVSVSEGSAARYAVLSDWVNKKCDVTGNGVALRRAPGTSSERVGLFYLEDDPWVVTSGEYQDKDGYTWMKVTSSSLGLSGWVAQDYLKYKNKIISDILCWLKQCG